MTLLEYQCVSEQLPLPVREHVFAKPRRFRFDWAWIHEKVALEQEGGVWTRGRHFRGTGALRDMTKYNEAACLGWIVIRATPAQVQDGSAFAWVKRAIRTRQGEPS